MSLGKTVVREINDLNELYEIEKEKRGYFKSQETDLYKRNVLFFRGQSDYLWKLEPGIKRQNNLNEWEELREYNPKENTLFKYIAKCQHYGKKTRFLDFSTDMDIALFFACNENENKDGSLYMCPYMPRKSSWYDTVIISELSILKNEIAVGEFAKQLYTKYADLRNGFANVNELSTQIVSWLDHGFMVLPDVDEYEIIKKDNLRIYNQKGAFFICGNHTKKRLDSWGRISSHAENNIIIPKVCDIPDIMQNNIFVTKVRIPSFLKISIMEWLNEKGINKENLLDV